MKATGNLSKASSKISKKTPSPTTNAFTSKVISKGAYPHDTSSFVSNDDTIPATIFTPIRESKSGKRYQIFIAPHSPSELDTLCFKPMTDGFTFCIDKNCIVNHRGDEERFLVAPGEAFIKFSKTRAYKDPSINSLLWSDDVLEAWNDDSEPMDVWMSRFRLVRGNLNNNPGHIINAHSIKLKRSRILKVLESVNEHLHPSSNQLNIP